MTGSAPPALRDRYSGSLEPGDANRIAEMRQAGLHGDHSQVAALIQTLRNPPHQTSALTALHALAQLGATEALPVFIDYLPKSVLQRDPDPFVSNFAQAARARLMAEAAAANMTDPQARADAKIKSFFAELGMTPADLNAGMAAYRAPQENASGNHLYSSAPKIVPIQAYAARELADMIYRDSLDPAMNKAYATLPCVAAVNFSQDYGAALKMRLAPMAPSERLAVVIEELAHKTSLSFDDYYEIQLAVNEGQAASQTAAAELRQMDDHRDQYNQARHHGGFTALFQIIWGVGDKEQAPLLAYFKNDTDLYVAHYAAVMYDDVLQGTKRESQPAY